MQYIKSKRGIYVCYFYLLFSDVVWVAGMLGEKTGNKCLHNETA